MTISLMKRVKVAIVALALVAAASACAVGEGSGNGDEGGDYPSQAMDWTIAFGPGGGNDRLSRQIVEILQQEDLYPEDIMLENREGGSGATGWGYLYSQKGSGYGIATTSGSFITTPLQADTGWTGADFTPVGSLVTEDSFFMVRGDSAFKTWADWVAYAKEKGTVTVGGTGLIQINFILQKLIASEAGYKIKYVPFNEDGQVQSALLSKSIDAMFAGPGEVLGQIEAGKMRALMFTGPEPLAQAPDIPTAESLGMAPLPSQPYGLVLPPDAPDSAKDWWIATMKKVVETPAWKKFIEQQGFSENVMWDAEFTTYLEQTTETFKRILTEEGAL
ncbi:Bug family tripartite tricarboxylate transporter substrate binding protein [Nocardioides daejeonensis]|uniref:Bug family tripartite tricarboxylate transporter substrate binding protein n=1 Tax=Nocardioides daejeonensis TaxID=1046556 RepID=UPI001EF72AEB|nr:tripartite tricarboxylate transporter substrate binding protein [Nocardioides daejeonensis]